MQISVLGCGWLGLPLAQALLAEGHIIKGSTTTEAKLSLLQQEGIKPFLISLPEGGPAGNFTDFLKGSDVLIIDVPPKLGGDKSESYVEKIRSVIPAVEAARMKKVLFVSSTSVYADDNSVVTEVIVPKPETESGRQLLETEKLLQENLNFKTTILRFGGLIGEGRHPVYHLTGRENLPNPDAPVNLIHRDDCIGIIKAIIAKDAWGETFNAVAPYHPTREEYYTAKAKELGLVEPHFDDATPSVGKTIASGKLISRLDYNFLHQL